MTLTLPFAGADGDSRVCRWLEGIGPGTGWDCNATYTTYALNRSVTRSHVTGFSDWAVGDGAGPTAVSLQSLRVGGGGNTAVLPLLLLFIGLLLFIPPVLRRRSF